MNIIWLTRKTQCLWIDKNRNPPLVSLMFHEHLESALIV